MIWLGWERAEQIGTKQQHEKYQFLLLLISEKVEKKDLAFEIRQAFYQGPMLQDFFVVIYEFL